MSWDMLSRNKKTYLIVMLVCGVALVVDRLIGDGVTGPDVAVAAVKAAPVVQSDAADNTDGYSIPELPFPRKIPAIDPTRPIRDLFAPPEELRGGADGGSRAYRQERTPQHELFVREHRLDGVMVDEDLRIAIVNGQAVRVGQMIDGCALTAVLGSSVHFRCPDGEARLRIHPLQ